MTRSKISQVPSLHNKPLKAGNYQTRKKNWKLHKRSSHLGKTIQSPKGHQYTLLVCKLVRKSLVTLDIKSCVLKDVRTDRNLSSAE